MTDEQERDIRIGEHRASLDEDGIVHCTVVGDLDAKTANAFNAAVLRLMNMIDGKVNVLTDNNRAGKPSREARKICEDFVLHDKYGKLAVFGVHPVSGVLANFFIKFAKKKDIRYFSDEDEALQWLKE